MAQAFAELEASDETVTLTHADWLGRLLERELTHRRDKRLAARLRYARLRQQASVEDVDYRAPRGLDRALFHKLTNGEWIDAHDNLILCGPTGVGKADPVGPPPNGIRWPRFVPRRIRFRSVLGGTRPQSVQAGRARQGRGSRSPALPSAAHARRVRGHRAAQKQHHLAPPHSMTSSARARIAGGMVRP